MLKVRGLCNLASCIAQKICNGQGARVAAVPELLHSVTLYFSHSSYCNFSNIEGFSVQYA